VHAGHKVMMEVDGNSLLTVCDQQETIDKEPCLTEPINPLIKIVIVFLLYNYFLNYN
jgi:hypothetical protein